MPFRFFVGRADCFVVLFLVVGFVVCWGVLCFYFVGLGVSGACVALFCVLLLGFSLVRVGYRGYFMLCCVLGFPFCLVLGVSLLVISCCFLLLFVRFVVLFCYFVWFLLEFYVLCVFLLFPLLLFVCFVFACWFGRGLWFRCLCCLCCLFWFFVCSGGFWVGLFLLVLVGFCFCFSLLLCVLGAWVGLSVGCVFSSVWVL